MATPFLLLKWREGKAKVILSQLCAPHILGPCGAVPSSWCKLQQPLGPEKQRTDILQGSWEQGWGRVLTPSLYQLELSPRGWGGGLLRDPILPIQAALKLLRATENQAHVFTLELQRGQYRRDVGVVGGGWGLFLSP